VKSVPSDREKEVVHGLKTIETGKTTKTKGGGEGKEKRFDNKGKTKKLGGANWGEP